MKLKFIIPFVARLRECCILFITHFILKLRLIFKKLSYKGAMNRKVIIKVGSNHASVLVWTFPTRHTDQNSSQSGQGTPGAAAGKLKIIMKLSSRRH